MTVAAALAILQAILGAAPEIAALIASAGSGGTVSEADIQAILTKYGVDRIVFAAAISAAKAAGH